MSQKFKFNILTGENAQSKYDAITTKEPFTFYLLQTGVGYLGEKKLFDAASLDNTEVTLTGKFFRAVASHVITQADLDNANLSKPEGTAVGDAGILFTADNNETDDGDEPQYFVPIKIPAIVDTIDGDNPGNEVPTTTAVVNYINQVLGNYVTFEIDGAAGTPTSDGDLIFPGTYSTNEVRIGTWVDGKPLYRKVINQEFTVTSDNGSGKESIECFSQDQKMISAIGYICAKNDNTTRRTVSSYYTKNSQFWSFAVSQNGNNLVLDYQWPIKETLQFSIVIEYINTTD